jgi:cytochrome P450
MVKDGPSGDLFLNLVKRYPNEELISLNTLGNHILIAKPRLLADLFVHRCYHFTKPTKVSSFLRHILGDGLIIVEGDHHKFLRKNTMPAFHFRHIKDLYPMMWEKAEILTRTLREEIDQQAVYSTEKSVATEPRSGVIELNTWASKVTLDIIGVAGLGRDFRAVETGNDPLQQLFEQLLEPSRDKLVFSVASFIFGLSFVKLLPWKMNGVFAHLTTSLDDYCRPMIAEKKKAIAAKDDHFDILSLLIKSDNFSDDALKDQLITFLAAG